MRPPTLTRARIIILCGVVGVLALTSAVVNFWPAQQAAVVAPAPSPQVVRQAPPAPPVLDAKSTLILELFNPSDQSLTHQLNETAITQQIEQVLTTTFVLTKCDIITQDDYRNNFRALILYATHMKLAPDAASAEAKVRQIAESSSASYSLVYSRTKCDDPSLPGIAEKLLAWQHAYLSKQP